ncbi:MAG: glycosyltransferase family 4 protein [Opitutaceae bacterium]
MAQHRINPPEGPNCRRFTDYSGIFFDEFAENSAWLREEGCIRLPPLDGVRGLVLKGELRAHPEARGVEAGFPALTAVIDGVATGEIASSKPGPWELRFELPNAGSPDRSVLALRLEGVAFTNALAWLGRVTGLGPLQRFRRQNKNRQLRLSSLATDAGEIIYDFAQRQAPFSREFARGHARLGINIVGFLTADLGIGESARCMARAADAARIPAALVPLKLNCRNRLGDMTYASRLQEDNPHAVNVIHVDPPASRDIDHHHGRSFRAARYNVGYFAWELPEFPDAWLPSFDYFDEIWCPSQFTREAIALKCPLPVLAMPHAISVPAPAADTAQLRARLGLPAGPFLFLTLFDLNSYAERKNPGAAIQAFRESGLDPAAARLVVKVQNAQSNAAEFEKLQAALAREPGAILIFETLDRGDVWALEAACDCLVSLHRAEGFGLAAAECMALGKPAISTDWSATAEYVNSDNGCPVRARIVSLEKSHGPYSRGATWADADTAHAAEWMRRLAGDRALAARLGESARSTIAARFSPEAIGARYRRRLEIISAF